MQATQVAPREGSRPSRDSSASLAPFVDALYADGITALQSAFPRGWVEQLRQEMMAAFWDAIQRPGGAVGRGPRRWYVETHPRWPSM